MARKKRFRLTPPDPSEDQFQHSIANLLDAILLADQVAWSHFPAGGYFLTPAARARLYRLGLKQGFPDLVICYSVGRVLWLEVKTATGVVSPAQRAMHLLLRRLGHHVVVVRKIEHVIAALLEYGVPFRCNSIAEGYIGTSISSDASGAAAERTQSSSSVGSSQPGAPP